MGSNGSEKFQWEGADLSYYYNGEDYCIGLSDTQFAVIGKILGLQINGEKASCFSDETLRKFMQMEGNPLRLDKD